MKKPINMWKLRTFVRSFLRCIFHQHILELVVWLEHMTCWLRSVSGCSVWPFSGLLEPFCLVYCVRLPHLFRCFHPLVSLCGSRCGSSRHLCVKETTDGLRRHIPFGRFSLIIDSGDFLNESLLLLAGFRPRHAEFPAHRKKDTINKRSKLHRPHLLSSIPQSLQKIKWQIEAAAVTLFVLKTHRCTNQRSCRSLSSVFSVAFSGFSWF